MTSIWESNAHPLYKMVLDEFSPGVPQLAILLAVVVAPVFEEIMFRGIIQNWLVRLGRGGKSLSPSLWDVDEGNLMTRSHSGAWSPG